MMAYANPYQFATGKGSGNPYFPDAANATSDLPLWQRNELLDQLGTATRPTTSKLLDLLNTGVSAVYDIGLGRRLGSGSTAGEALDALRLRPSEEALGGWGRPLAELGLDVVADPLNLVSFGAGAAGKARAAAKAAGLMDNLPLVAGRQLADDVARGAANIDNLGDLGYARNATRSLEDSFGHAVDNLTNDDLLSRQIVGNRTAGRRTTLRQLVDAAPNQADAIKAVDDFLKKNYSQSYADVADDFLYHDAALHLPKFLGGEIPFSLPGGERAAALFDRAGQAARWSPAGRMAAAAFSKSAFGKTDEATQILARSFSRADSRAAQTAGRWTTRMMRELAERSPAVFEDPALSSAVRNTIEGTATAAERQAVTANDLDSFVTRWQQTANDYIQRSRDAGIGSAELADPYGTKYFPRSADKDIWDNAQRTAGSRSATQGRDWSVMTGDQLARDAAYQVPGGTNTINRLSRDAAVLDATTDAQAADYIYNTINATTGAGPAYSRQQAMKLARDIRAMTPQARAAGRGLFDTHFTEDAARYVRGRERAIERSNVIYDLLGASANPQNYAHVPGGAHDSINKALADLDLRTVDNRSVGGTVQGARQQIVDRINARMGGAGPQLTVDDLANVSIDQRTIERLTRIADYYAMPEVQGVMGKFMDDLTRMWKSSVLSFPSRYARDWFSGAISNLIEVGPNMEFIRGYAAAKYLLQGQMDRLAPLVAEMPRYSTLASTNMDAAIAAFRDDLGAAGLLNGRRIDDVGAVLTGRQTGETLLDAAAPGARPVTTMGYQVGDVLSGRTPLPASNAAYSELYDRGIAGYTDAFQRFGQALRNPSSIPDYLGDKTLRDPILRWGAQLGDTTDAINRLGGYAGLLLSGVSPQEAARRMAAAQIDYASLTRFEQGFIKTFVPFWSYNSRIGKYVAEKIFERPGGAYTKTALRVPEAVSEVGGSGDGGYTPKQIKENVGFSLEGFRDIPLLGNIVNAIAPETEGVQSFLNSIEVPGTGLINMFNVKQGLDGSVQPLNSVYNTFLDTTSQLMHPLARDAVELLTGRNLHTGKSLSEFEPTVQKLGRNLGVQPAGGLDTALKYSNYLLDFVPHAPRALQMTNRLIDLERVPDPAARVSQNLVNALTGVKVSNISEDAARFDASRELMDMMGDSPVMRQYTNTFIPEELLPFASPEDLMIYRLDRQMRKEARDARKRMGGDSPNPYGL